MQESSYINLPACRTSLKFLIVAVAVFGCVVLNAQNIRVIDSLRRVYTNATPENQFELLNAIGFEYRYSIPDSTIFYCLKAYDLGTSLHLKKNLSKPLSFIGLANANKGDFKQSVKYHYEAIEAAIAQNDSVQLAFGYNNLGRMFFDEGDIARATANLRRSKELFELLHNKSGLAYVYRSMANIYKTQSDYGQALEMSERAFKLRKEIGDPRGIMSALVELGMVYDAMSNNERALEKFKIADSLSQKIDDKVTRAEVKLGMAEILFKQKKYKDAYEAADRTLSIVTRKTNQRLFLRANLLRANYFQQTKDYGRAIPLFEMLAAEDENNLSFKRDASFQLAAIYKILNNPAKEAAYSSEFKILDEKVHSTDLLLQVNQLKFKLDLEKIEKENEVLKINRTRDKELIAKQHTQNMLLLISVISITAALFVVCLQSRKRKIMHQELESKNEQVLAQGEEIATKNQDLSERNEELSALNNEKDTLMNIVAHDLKSPINHVLGLTQIMEMEGGLSVNQKNYVRLIKEATHSGLGLIVDLLDVNALKENKESLNFQVFEWKRVVEEQTRSFEPAAIAKQIRLVLKVTSTSSVVSEPKYIRRILDNLISNAIKFSKRGTQVEVITGVSNNIVSISVKDDGPGFSEEDRKSLFQRFKKLSARPTAGESSNGLGLTIVKTLVDRLGGSIELISEPGKGSKFLISIPVKIVEKSAL